MPKRTAVRNMTSSVVVLNRAGHDLGLATASGRASAAAAGAIIARMTAAGDLTTIVVVGLMRCGFQPATRVVPSPVL